MVRNRLAGLHERPVAALQVRLTGSSALAARLRTIAAALTVAGTVAVALLPAAAPAHPGGLAKDGCHDHRASGACHCHREGAARPGCTAGSTWGKAGGEAGVGEAGAGSAPAPAPSFTPPSAPAPAPALAPSSAPTPAPAPAPASPSPPLPSDERPRGTPPARAEWIRIASWNLNVLHWRTGGALWRGAVARGEDDYRILARYARDLDADVIAFQEVNGPRAAARVFPVRDYDLHLSGRYDSRYDDIYVGFAVRRGRFDRVVRRDEPALGLGTGSRYELRWGVDLAVRGDGRTLRLLNVHLKSGCFAKSLESPRGRYCRKLARQIEPLESWIDARWREGTPFVVLGDFNRAMDRHGPRDHLWRALDDRDPPGLKLHRLPSGRSPACWRGTSRHHRHPIDFFVFGARAWRRVDPASFRQIVWATADADPRRGLPSDHCPITVDLFR